MATRNESYIVTYDRSIPRTMLPDDCLDFEEWYFCRQLELKSQSYLETFEPVQPIRYVACQQKAPWHLPAISRVDYGSTDTTYAYDPVRLPKRVYILDSWADVEHPEFEKRLQRGPAFLTGEHYHGTHVAGLVGSKTYGVLKNVQMVSVQVLDGKGQGNSYVLLQGLHWLSKQPTPGVVNLSLAGPYSQSVNRAIQQLDKLGWLVVAAAGNDAQDACKVSPASAEEAITVGAFDKQLRFASFSNWGRCVDILAPGRDILSTYPDQQTALASGTSMAAPIVAGILAAVQSGPALAKIYLKTSATVGRIRQLPDLDTPNRKVFQPHTSQCQAINCVLCQQTFVF